MNLSLLFTFWVDFDWIVAAVGSQQSEKNVWRDDNSFIFIFFLFFAIRFGLIRSFLSFYLSLSFSMCVTFVLSVILWLWDDCCCGYWCCCATLRMCVDVVSNQINLQPIYGRHINGLNEPVRLQATIVLISKHLNTLHTIPQIHNFIRHKWKSALSLLYLVHRTDSDWNMANVSSEQERAIRWYVCVPFVCVIVY